MMSRDDTHEEILERRARRHARRGEYRKAALALRERAALVDDAKTWVALGDMLRRAGRAREALRALKQGMYRHRRAGASGRARTVARMIVALDPWDAKAARAA
ncbi:MAG TPA: hypothetical protein RMH99_19300 [Sandaracinaceae bacterium LLY-WYZ-13_1]|nr:hypothetical protein [Sandaracinaceae bacterium LLY-WYZ-13_1]